MKLNIKNRARSAFTVVELIIVIAVIAILATVTIVAYNGVQQNAHQSALLSDLDNSAAIMARDLNDNGAYATSVTAADGGNGLPTNSGTTYQYTVNNSASPPTFCLTGTNSNISYYINNNLDTPTKGACPGDGVNGVPPITNLSTNPRALSGAGGWTSNNSTIYPVTTGVAVTGQPNGITTAAMSQLAAGQSNASVLSIYNIDNMGNSTTSRTVGAWVYVSASGYQAYIYAPTPTYVALSPNTWTYVQSSSPITGWAMVAVTKISGLAGSSDYAYATGSMVVAGSGSYNFADGSSSSSWVWNGAVNTSTSTGPPQ